MSIDVPIPLWRTNREIVVRMSTSNGVHVGVRKRA